MRGIFFSLGTEELIYNRFKKPKKWPPIWTFAIRLRLFIFRGKGPILLHIIEIYFIPHRTALRFSHSDTRNLTFHLIEVLDVVVGPTACARFKAGFESFGGGGGRSCEYFLRYFMSRALSFLSSTYRSC